ncbi:MAG: nucleotidyltransferase domain-containing protein [Deltaproteobacteria bacterium]|nr:nucleotidyltransferase domain-containing protein [Deltaproteobacteria bacterium]
MSPNAISRDEVFRELRHVKEELKVRYGVTRIGIFGSVARSEIKTDSDVDVVVEMKPNLFMRAGLKAELESRFGKSVDVVRYRQGMNRHLKARIDRDALYV